MDHMNIGSTCFTHPNGMWLLLGAIFSTLTFSTVQLHPTSKVESINNTTTTIQHLSSIDVEGTKSDSANVTHSYTEDTTSFDLNTTDSSASPSTVDDQLIDVTSSLTKPICAICAALEFNYTDSGNVTSNSSSYLLGNATNGSEEESFFNLTVIGVISVLVIVILALIGGLGFFAYRHFAWNRPQTLTDKFSNDESTGYIDDTAFRENSEEMYSLDNDSFLNSLEAMTIQNYWTDHVRHTKL